MSMLFKFMTAMLMYFLCLLIFNFSSTNLITSLFLVLSMLNTSNNLSIGSILILLFFTNCLLILVWVQLESFSAFNCNSFSFNVLIFVYTFSSLSLLSCWFGIIYWFWELLCTEVCCTMSTSNLQRNSFTYYYSLYLIFSKCFCSLSSVLICNILLNILLYHTYSVITQRS